MVLLEMYNEANFYRLESLCKAIRKLPSPEQRFGGTTAQMLPRGRAGGPLA